MRPALLSDEPVELVESTHQYFVGEGISYREVPSLSRAMERTKYGTDYSTVDPDYLATRASVGHCVHRAILAYFSDVDPEACVHDENRFIQKQAEVHFEKFLRWADRHTFEPWYLERPVFNPELGYACTPDYVGLLDMKPIVLDWKTTYNIAKHVAVQTMGQARCFKWIGALPYRAALHLPKRDKAAELVPFTEHHRDLEALEHIAGAERLRRHYA